MPYCPKCGNQTLDTDRFCIRCGYDFQSRTSPSPAIVQAPSQPIPSGPVHGLTPRNAYIITEEGLLKIRRHAWLFLLPVVLAISIGIPVATLSDSISPLALTVVLVLFFTPILDFYRSRRLRKLLDSPRTELLSAGRAILIPWSTIQAMTIKGRRAEFYEGGRWTSLNLAAPDVTSAASTASAFLSNRFSLVPNPPRRLFSTATRFVVIVIILFVVTQLITIAASLTPLFPGEETHYTSLYNNTQSALTGIPITTEWAEIFLNNVQVALGSMIPFLGFLTLSISSYNTGRVVQIASAHFNPPVAPSAFLSLLYILPHAWVEELSYPIAGALGLHALLQWRRQSWAEFSNWKTRGSTKLFLGFAAVAFILAVAAALEVSIEILKLDVLFLWAPVALMTLVLYFRLGPKISAALS